MTLQILPVLGLGAVSPGDDLVSMLATSLQPLAVATGDVLVVTHKVVSKSEGAVVEIVGDEERFRVDLIESEACRSCVDAVI